MTDARDRLRKCFDAVFPLLPVDAVDGAAVGQTADWDSLATLTLLAAVEQEFAISVPAADLEEFSSFDGIARYLEGRCSPKLEA